MGLDMATLGVLLAYISLVFNVFTSLAHGSILYEGGTVIAFDEVKDRLQVLENASVLIEGNTITQVGSAVNSSAVASNITRIDAKGKIISPGFIDVHHHLWQTAFRSIASNTTLVEYFQRYSAFSPAIQSFTPEDVRLGYLMSIFEMQYQGTTTVLDHAHATWSDEHVDAAVDASFDSDIRSYFAYAVQPLPTAYTWDDQLAKIQSLAGERRFEDAHSLVKLGLAYDSFYAAPESNISALWNLVSNNSLPLVTTHYVGGPWGAENSPELLNTYGWLNTSIPVVFSHGSFLTYQDADILRQTNQYMCSTPESEFHYGHVNPNAHHIQDQTALGVDTHFTFSSSMVQQARLWLQSLRREAFLKPEEGRWELPLNNPMSVEQAFHLITRAGALALRRSDLGAIKVGAKADLVVFGTDSPNMIAATNPVAAIILHADVSDIEDVMVDGKFVKWNGKLTHPAYHKTRAGFLDSAERIQEEWAQMEWSPLEDFQSGLSGPTTRIPRINVERGAGTGY